VAIEVQIAQRAMYMMSIEEMLPGHDLMTDLTRSSLKDHSLWATRIESKAFAMCTRFSRPTRINGRHLRHNSQSWHMSLSHVILLIT